MPGRGGWGDPFELDPDHVVRDVVTEKIIIDSARRDYGVAIDSETLRIDESETMELRSAPRSGKM